MVPISWVYFITTRDSRINRSFAQTMLILPIIVAAIANIVQNSIPLAFSLAGIVAAVRFRFTLTDPSHTLYIFAAITIGLGAGIAAVGVSLLISIAFVYLTLVLWRLDYGRDLNTPFYSFLTGRDYGKDDDTTV
jgi:ABC-type tungstate transport system substrate-binding protein